MMQFLRLVVLGLGLVCLCGCGSMSATEDRHAIPRPERQYAGLKGQSAAIMVWTDWHTRNEYPRIQLDLARATQNRLEVAYKIKPEPGQEQKEKAKAKEEPPAIEFLNPASVVRFQRERPETEGQPIVQVAPRLGAGRVIYIELEDFDAHSAQSIMLLKGTAKATLRVVEVVDGRATVVFEEPGIQVHFPPNAPEGVVPDDKRNVRTIYVGTVDRLAEAICARFAEGK